MYIIPLSCLCSILATGEDFNLTTPASVVFSVNVSNSDILCAGIGIVDDDIYEGSEQFLIDIASVSPSSVAIIGTLNLLLKNITDNEGGSFSYFASYIFRSGFKYIQMLLLVL